MIVQATHFLMGVLLVMADTTSLTFLEQGWMSQAFNKDIENISSTSNCRLEPGCVCLSVHVSVWSATSEWGVSFPELLANRLHPKVVAFGCCFTAGFCVNVSVINGCKKIIHPWEFFSLTPASVNSTG